MKFRFSPPLDRSPWAPYVPPNGQVANLAGVGGGSTRLVRLNTSLSSIWYSFSLSVPPLIRPETSFREIGFVAYSTVISKCIGCPARRIPIFHTWVAPFSSFRARREHRLVSVRSSIDDRHSGNDPSWYVNACDLHCIQVLTRNYTFPIGLAGPD